MSKLVALLNDESGAAAAEYVLILAIVGTALATAAATFGSAIATAMGHASTLISTPAA
jgi:pilus assembly protein Flp/PilA